MIIYKEISVSILFTPAWIDKLEIKNRFVRSATYEGMGTSNWGPSDELRRLYEDLSNGGVGLVITGGAFVKRHKNFRLAGRAPTPFAMDDDNEIGAWKSVTKRVHECGAKIAMQITHPGGRDNPVLRGDTPISSSDIKDKRGDVVARTMSVEEIGHVVEDFAQACRRVMESGFDAVQLHGGHGFLISSFISPYLNNRTDQYGGSTENRARFITEIVERVRELLDENYPVMIKMNCDDFIPGGLDTDEAVRIAEIIVGSGISCIEVTGGLPESRYFLGSLESQLLKPSGKYGGEAYFRTSGFAIKEAVNVPVILVGGMRTLSVMEEILEEGAADFVSLSRPFIREPALVKRWASGDLAKAQCISCNQCLDNVFRNSLRCYAKGDEEERTENKGNSPF